MCFINIIIIADDNLLPSKDVQYFCDIVLFIRIVGPTLNIIFVAHACVVLCIVIYTVVLVILFTSSLDEFSNRIIH